MPKKACKYGIKILWKMDPGTFTSGIDNKEHNR